MKVICNFCGAELDSKDDIPTIVHTATKGIYTCHKVICYNKDKHPDKTLIEWQVGQRLSIYSKISLPKSCRR